MKQFWVLMEKSIIFTGLITLILVIGAVYMAAVGRPLPEWFIIALTSALGFFFGQKVGTQTGKQDEQLWQLKNKKRSG